MLKKILIVVGVVLIGFLIAVSMRPNEVHIERKASIAAAPEVVFPFINDFKEWGKWNPWGKMDPGMKITYSGPQAGAGASYSWKGNDKVGEGKMTIVESKPNEKVVEKLEFLAPFVATNTVTFSLKQAGANTDVTWSMDTQPDFMMKAMGMFMDMDKAVGGDFERGLASLKPMAEAKAKEAAASAPASAPAAPAAPAPTPSPAPAPAKKKK